MDKTKKIIFIVIAIIYFIAPIDLIPDAIVGIGQMDDLLIFILAVLNYFGKFSKRTDE